MRTKVLVPALIAGLFAVGFAFSLDMPAADAGAGKNLKVYPKDTDKKAIKADMKKMAKALGVQCDYCHDLSAMDEDSDMKNKARSMMKMTMDANKKLKKDGFKAEVTCNTCHAGNKKPKN